MIQLKQRHPLTATKWTRETDLSNLDGVTTPVEGDLIVKFPSGYQVLLHKTDVLSAFMLVEE